MVRECVAILCTVVRPVLFSPPSWDCFVPVVRECAVSRESDTQETGKLGSWCPKVSFFRNLLKWTLSQMAMGPQRQPFILCGLVLLVMVQIASTYITFQPQMYV